MTPRDRRRQLAPPVAMMATVVPEAVPMPKAVTAITRPKTAHVAAEAGRIESIRSVCVGAVSVGAVSVGIEAVIDHDVAAMAGGISKLTERCTDDGAADYVPEPVVMIRPR